MTCLGRRLYNAVYRYLYKLGRTPQLPLTKEEQSQLEALSMTGFLSITRVTAQAGPFIQNAPPNAHIQGLPD